MARMRLTKRIASRKERKAESQADGLFPGDVGNMERSKNYHAIDEYSTFEQQVNHELPDMRHDWKDNPRTPSGHGIPKMASVYRAAKNAAKLAVMFLGDKASDDEIEAQAKDFMRMGSKAMVASVNRWAELAGEDDCEVKAEEADETAEATDAADAETVKKDEEVVSGNECENGADCEKTAECEKTADDITVKPGEDEVSEEDILIDENVEAPEVDFDEAEEGEVEAEPELNGIFDDDDEDGEEATAPVGVPVASTKKAGIKRLAGQPKLVRVASKKDADELSGLWSKWENPSLR